MRAAVVDVETTGRSPAWGDRICEIAVVTVEGHRIVDRFQTLVNPERPIPWSATKIHHIEDRHVRGEPTFGRILSQILRCFRGAVLVAHNAGFDHRFLEHEVRRARGARYGLPVRAICTMKWARARYGTGNASLKDVCRCLGIPGAGRHRALPDAEATAELLLRLLGRRPLNERTIQDLERDGLVRRLGGGRLPAVSPARAP